VVLCLVTDPTRGQGGRQWVPPAWARVVHVDD
jgi:hypothetical protein